MPKPASELNLKPAPEPARRIWTEDWLAVTIGLVLFGIGLAGVLGYEPLGWAIKTNVWTNPTKILGPASAKYTGLPGLASLGLTYLLLAILLSLGTALRGAS